MSTSTDPSRRQEQAISRRFLTSDMKSLLSPCILTKHRDGLEVAKVEGTNRTSGVKEQAS
jgi:hypothetical protein